MHPVFAYKDHDWKATVHGPCLRYGEADHPGPNLRVGSFNPGQILGNEAVITDWGPGIWCGSETSHTGAAQRICSKKFREAGFNSAWSSPVPTLAHNSGTLRGRAMGVANVSTYPLHPYPCEYSHDVQSMSRLLENIVDLGHGHSMYIATIYGPTVGPAHSDPWAMLQALCATAFSHAHAFRGPAIVLGDFNADLDQCAGWQFMVSQGWVDAAAFDATRRGELPSATCRNKTRKTFILINQLLLASLTHCDVVETFDFDSHPLLVADFDLDVATGQRKVWSLTKTTDGLFFDDELLRSAWDSAQSTRGAKFEDAMRKNDITEAWRQVNLTFDDTIQAACVSTDGTLRRLPRGCLGRGRKGVIKTVPSSAPHVRSDRQGGYDPKVVQAPVAIRRNVRQVRRLQSLLGQLTARARKGLQYPQDAHSVWKAIFTCPGYHKSFATFVLDEFGIFVPVQCPHVEYVQYLYVTMRKFVDDEIAGFRRYNLQYRYNEVLRDIKKGGSDTYATVRDPPLPPFHYIDQLHSVVACKQRWRKGGIQTILFEGDASVFSLDKPVYFQGQEFFILHIQDNRMRSDRPLKNFNYDDSKIWQREVIADNAALHQRTAEAWSELWQRDDDTDIDWTSAIDKLQHIQGFPEIEFAELQVDEWKQHLKQVKRKSARGSCGYTPNELLQMPCGLTEWILRILMAIEEELADWPAPLMIARVCMLNKGETAPAHPLQVRPITITSKIYRNWARYRALQVLSILGNRLPPSLAGSTGGVSADMFAGQLLDHLESAQMDSLPVMGCTVDLVKCYNLVPREPILLAMAELGIPIPYLVALRSMFKMLRRVLELGGSTGDYLTSSTGIPEGCCFSIVAMLTLSVWVSFCLQSVEPNLTFAAYADNWTIIAYDMNGLLAAIQELLMFVQSVAMRVAEDKSWVWASHARERRQLKQRAPFALKLISVELGCDAAYCRKTSKAVAKKRMQKVKRVLTRVRRRKLPRAFKVNMCNQLSSSIVGYGSEFTFYTHPEIRSLRAAKCRATGRAWNGCNPFLSTTVVGDLPDPELCLGLRKIFFWRRFLKKFPGRQQQFFDKVAVQHSSKSNGPAGVFNRSLQELGWTCQPDGFLQHDRGWCLNWFRASSNHVRKCIGLSWNVKATRLASNRRGFSRSCMDVDTVAQVVRKLDGPKHTDAVNFLIGKHVTNDGLVHYSRKSSTASCPLCSAKDTREHRIFDCCAMNDIRSGYGSLMEWLNQQDETFCHFAVPELDLQWADHQLQHAEVNLPDIRLRDSQEEATVFTDGSAVFTGSFVTAQGAGAYVCCKDAEVLETKAYVLPGPEQSAHRAEIWAFLLALMRFPVLLVYSDCASMISIAQYLIQCRDHNTEPVFRDNADLWGQVWNQLSQRPPHSVQIQKVKAHANWQQCTDVVEKWKGQLNDRADRLAKQCEGRGVASRKPAILQFERDRKTTSKFLLQFFNMWHQMNQRCLAAISKSRGDRFVTEPTFAIPANPNASVFLTCSLTEEVLKACPLGEMFGRRLCDYFHGLAWDFNGPGVTIHELFADFTITTRTSPPVLCHVGARGRRGPVKTYNLADVCIAADTVLQQQTFTEQIRTWRSGIRWLLKVWPDNPIGIMNWDCPGLRQFGYVYPVKGFKGYPVLRSGSAVLLQMWHYFHPSGRSIHHMHRKWLPHPT
eukprot:Skav213934  [mRNA]  locus=scaffold2679:137352:142349:+ [translate_table: standard]